MAKTRFNEMRKSLTNMNVSMQLRLRLLKCSVWSVLFYGCKAWTLDRKLRRRLNAVEMWLLRRMLRVLRTALLTNKRVMEIAGVYMPADGRVVGMHGICTSFVDCCQRYGLVVGCTVFPVKKSAQGHMEESTRSDSRSGQPHCKV